MRSIIHLVSIVLLSCFLPVGCRNGELYKKEVERLDSLLVELDSAELRFRAIDSAGAHAALQDVNMKLGRAGELFADTLQKEQAMLLSGYRSVRKPMKEYMLKSAGTYKEIGVTRKQLRDLRHDMQEGLIKKEDAELNFQKETNLAGLLINSLTLTSQTIDFYLKRYQELTPRIDSLIQVKENESKLPPGK